MEKSAVFYLTAYRYRPAGREVNFMKHAHQIKSVAPGSIAEELELEPGDKILQINGQDIEDVLAQRIVENRGRKIKSIAMSAQDGAVTIAIGE